VPTFLDAAYQVLENADFPMSAEEIARLALDQGLLMSRGATPAATMSASLYMDIKEKGATSKFIRIGPNQFTLNGKSEPQPEPAAKRKSINGGGKRKSKLSLASSAHELLDREILLIQSFLSGESEQPPTSEKICDWVVLCYTLGLYLEGVGLFNYVDSTELNGWFYERTKKMARLCAMKS
jgi:HB1, ASXL, restriction endonuclease HTH domain